MKLPAFHFNAQLNKEVFHPVVTKDEMVGKVWVKLPFSPPCDYVLFQFEAIAPKRQEIEIKGNIEFDCSKPWLHISVECLDLNIGLHKYKLSFMHKDTSAIINVYFSYIYQDEDFEKAYRYMDKYRNDKCEEQEE